jgi:hypothetical protein
MNVQNKTEKLSKVLHNPVQQNASTLILLLRLAAASCVLCPSGNTCANDARVNEEGAHLENEMASETAKGASAAPIQIYPSLSHPPPFFIGWSY